MQITPEQMKRLSGTLPDGDCFVQHYGEFLRIMGLPDTRENFAEWTQIAATHVSVTRGRA